MNVRVLLLRVAHLGDSRHEGDFFAESTEKDYSILPVWANYHL